MVSKLHGAGLEVILDVVYNHTAEGNEKGPTLSFKGIDNASYYRLLPDKKRYYINDTGTGNTVNLSHPRVIQMVMDSLRYWAEHMHIDGFRFDLGTILAREVYGFDEQSGFLKAMDQDPVLSPLKLIAEPWDTGPGGYQVGGFPPGWAEWNDKFRDTVRDYWRAETAPARLAPRLLGSGDVFNREGRRSWSSVNFITAHDGFTLNDWASYNDKHNEANGEGNKDGNSSNHSWNCGVEGPTDNKDILALREKQKRNMLATLLLSQGTPMLLGGDEFGRTQQGNNNAYCQDNDISWFDWNLGESAQKLLTFVKRVIQLRRDYPILRRSRFLTGAHDAELDIRDVSWINPGGSEMRETDWNNGWAMCFGMILDGRCRKTAIKRYGEDDSVLVVMNSFEGEVDFKLPHTSAGPRWTRLLDTSEPEDASGATFEFESVYKVPGRSFVVFVAGEIK
jgi:glycogen operon protein